MAHAISPIENPLQIRSVRRTVARLATELTKRELHNCNLSEKKKRNLRKERENWCCNFRQNG
jgi:hypothetical protein